MMQRYAEEIKRITESCTKVLDKINDNYMSGKVSYEETNRREEEMIILAVGAVAVFAGAIDVEMDEIEQEEREEEKRTRMDVQRRERLLRLRTRHRIRLERIQDGAPGKHFAGQDMCAIKAKSPRPTSPTLAVCSRKPSVRRKLFK